LLPNDSTPNLLTEPMARNSQRDPIMPRPVIPVISLLLLATATSLFAQSDTEELPEGIAATVDGKPITELAVDTVMEQVNANQEQPASREQIVNELIDLELLTQVAERAGMDKEPEVATALRLQYAQTMANAYLAQLGDGMTVTDEELRAEYDAQASNLEQQEYRASHILLDDEQTAQEVLKEVQAGGDFAALASEHSTGPTGADGGDLGWFQEGNMVAEFADAVKVMEVGAVSDAPVRTDFGWHVIKLIEKRGAAAPDFEAVAPGLRNIVLRNKLAAEIERVRGEAQIVQRPSEEK